MSNKPEQPNRLFSEQDLHDMEGNLFAEREDTGPVKCLGMEFPSDDARREYFRAKLREKLPKLKEIEGFPIGKDDDIIALSDPPYYTACPNPWLNDFIAQWEEEKKDLEAKGLRDPNFEVKEPYAADVSEGKNNPIYNAHSYHTKVPHPAIMRYLLHYTQPGDIVYDGFAGTGMTGVAAQLCGSVKDVEALGESSTLCGIRHSICSDLSPVASLICANYNVTHDNKVLENIARILDSSELKFKNFYTTKHNKDTEGIINYVVWSDVFICPSCGEHIVFYNEAVDATTGKVADTFKCPNCSTKLTKKNIEKNWKTEFDSILNDTISVQEKVPVLINYCVGGKTFTKSPDAEDLIKIQEAEKLLSGFSYVSNRMTLGSEARRNDRQGITHVHHFYFPKTLLVLQDLFPQALTKEFLFLLNSQLVNISKLNRYRPGVSFPYNPLSGTLYIGSQISEANPFIAFRNKLKKLIVAFAMIKHNNISGVCSASESGLPDNSVDYIFTDPPFGANISYSELNFIQESWLKVITNNQQEAIENDSLNKSKSDYQELMSICLKEHFRVLKPGKWMTIEFSNTSAAIWNAIQRAIQEAGFVIANISSLDKQQGSFKAVTTTTAVRQDLIISCFKPSALYIHNIHDIEQENLKAWMFTEDLLWHLPIHIKKEQKTTSIVERSPKILYDRLIAYYVQHGYPVPMDAHEFQQGLRERFVERDGMFFTAAQAIEYEEKKKLAPEFVPMGLIVSDEANGIEWLKQELKQPQTYQEIHPKWLQALDAVRKNDIIPELRQLLEENFIEEPNGKWRLPNIQDDKDVMALRTKSLMREFKLYVEQASKPKAKIKEARVEALRAGFKQCYIDKDFKTIVMVGDKIPQNLRDEDEVLLQFYDIALNKL